MHLDLAESTVRADRIRERTKQLEPYIEAFNEAQWDLARESVFVFWSLHDSSKGKVLSLPNGACVLDALREAEKQFGLTLPLKSTVSCNGASTEATARLQNGNVLKIPTLQQM